MWKVSLEEEDGKYLVFSDSREEEARILALRPDLAGQLPTRFSQWADANDLRQEIERALGYGPT